MLVTQSCLTSQPPWTVACQTPVSMQFSRQKYWSGLPFLPTGNFPNSEIKPNYFVSLELASGFFTTDLPSRS